MQYIGLDWECGRVKESVDGGVRPRMSGWVCGSAFEWAFGSAFKWARVSGCASIGVLPDEHQLSNKLEREDWKEHQNCDNMSV